jgi:hypothetical protein
MAAMIEIVDRGRGPQLSTSRITVQDVFPYLRQRFSYAEIQEIMPVVTVEEIQVIERYVQEHYQEVLERDRRIRKRAAERRKPPEAEEAEREARRQRLDAARETIRRQRQERNGEAAR